MNEPIKSDEKISTPKPQNSLQKSNPKEYYAQSCVKFSELRRDSEKTAKSIDKLNSEIGSINHKLSNLRNALKSKKELFGIINAELCKKYNVKHFKYKF